MDRLTPERRSWNMSRIRGKNTEPERLVRSILHRAGFRFSLRKKGLPGNPDIVLPWRRSVVFVHGCFWHRHSRCSYAVLPKTRVEFWLKKLSGNRHRDRRNVKALEQLGWQVIVVWECELRNETVLKNRLCNLLISRDIKE